MQVLLDSPAIARSFNARCRRGNENPFIIMANIASAAKRARQAERSNLRNRALKSKVKTIRKQILEAVEAGDKKAAATSLDAFSSVVDKASKTNLIHRNVAARSKGKLARKIAALG